MGNLNKVLLIGRLGQDPDKRVTPQGNSVITLNLATSEKFKDRNGNQQERTEWHRVIFWNQQADILEQYCRKGSELYVEGSLQTREWQDKDGNKRWTTEIQGRNFQFLGAKGQGQGGYQQQGQGGFQGQSQGGGFQQSQQSGNGFQQQSGNGFQQQGQGWSQPAQGGGGFQQPASTGGESAPMNDDFIEDDIPF